MSEGVILESDQLIHTPGMVNWGRNLTEGDFDQEHTRRFIRMGFFAELFPSAQGWVLARLADGEYTVEGETVIIHEKEAS